ncbi:MAG: 16S rRNA (adenine(1518)-N(6)/adenine(1519)-N(6))-dimethyltransferase RsmA [Candidatus Peribacteraceae bacterium]|nr:16S rRNA (adenine(1518)-N(6)/adenine(1519)-N(6))-dimethyltransferase RsmA [Candidatus Peribacteraceae bacterium]
MSALREEVSAFLQRHGLRLNTDLGQHFLVDEDTLESIVQSAKLSASDTVVEIGPGIGVLTRELLHSGAQVTAIELDARLIPLLRSFLKQSSESLDSLASLESRLHIIQGNALSVPMPSEPYKVTANIPYHITSPLLRHVFLESQTLPSSLTLLIQKEVARKICDKEDAGMLTVLVNLFGTPRYVVDVPADAFLPPPQVDSAVLHIDCFAAPLADPATIERVFSLTKLAFGQRRKMLRNTIGSLPEGMERLAEVQIEPTRRPQTLSVQEWIALAKTDRNVP